MTIQISASPNTHAVAYFARKRIVPSRMTEDEWAEIPAQLRIRAFYMPGVDNVRFLTTAYDKIMKTLKLEREKVKYGYAYVRRDTFIYDLRLIARDERIEMLGDITDPKATEYLGQFYDMQVDQSHGYAGWKMDQDTDSIYNFPAQEFLRISKIEGERSWSRRWIAAGGKFYGKPKKKFMIALKNDPIWIRISIFGMPWPPFDYNSGMGVESVPRESAIALDIIAPDQEIAADDMGFNDNLEYDVSALAPAFVEKLTNLFGTLVQIANGKLKWNKPSSPIIHHPHPIIRPR